MMPHADNRFVVSFLVGNGDSQIVERMHAELRTDGNYVLDNSPFYAFNISEGDVFLAEQTDDGLWFSGIFARGGHSTYRVKLPLGHEHDWFERNWSELERLGCSFEGSSANTCRLYSIDVPPGVDVAEAYRILEEKENQGVWAFEEAHYFNSETMNQ